MATRLCTTRMSRVPTALAQVAGLLLLATEAHSSEPVSPQPSVIVAPTATEAAPSSPPAIRGEPVPQPAADTPPPASVPNAPRAMPGQVQDQVPPAAQAAPPTPGDVPQRGLVPTKKAATQRHSPPADKLSPPTEGSTPPSRKALLASYSTPRRFSSTRQPPHHWSELERRDAALLGPTRPEWYGYQIMVLDCLSVSALAPAAFGGIGPIGAAAVATYFLGSPIVHAAHQQPGRAFASLGLRVGVPLGVAVVAKKASPEDEIGLRSLFFGLFVGVPIAMTIDSAALAWERKPIRQGLRLTPAIATTKNSGWIGLGGSF